MQTDALPRLLRLNLYGLELALHSSVPLSLPGSQPWSEDPVDVRVFLRVTKNQPITLDEPLWHAFHECPDRTEAGVPEFRAYRHTSDCRIRMAYADGFVIEFNQGGSSVDIEWPAHRDPAEVIPAFLGPVMGVLLRLHGTPSLHASAVVIDNLAVGLVGDSGAGKSTTAAAFARLGYPVLCDDVLALRETDTGILVLPAYPRIRLWPSSAAGLFGSADSLPKMTPSWEKRVLNLESAGFHFQDEPLPLGALIFLGPRGQDIEPNVSLPMRPVEALMRLVSDSFATNFQRPEDRAREFDLLSRLVQTLPLRQISAPADIGQIDSFCEAIVRDVRQQRARQVA